MKPLKDYSFSELMDMKSEEFEKVIRQKGTGYGVLRSLRKYMSIRHSTMASTIKQLRTNISNGSIKKDQLDHAEDTIEQMGLFMYSMEYKATLIYKRECELVPPKGDVK